MRVKMLYTVRTALPVLLCLLAVLAGPAAAGEQFYFTGMVAPEGSLSSPGHSLLTVYLRWDQMEGSLPEDLAQFRLLRDGEEVGTFPADAVMAAEEIAALYAGPEQQRRYLEMLARLIAWGQGQTPAVKVTKTNFASVLHELLLNDRHWGYFAARNDVNAAIARYRAYRDTEVSGGIHTYELQAVSVGGSAVKVGAIQLDIGTAQTLASAGGLAQIDLGRCDAPENNKDHGAVALTWELPGDSMGDRYIGSLLTSGYDIYRSTENVPAADAGMDLRALAGGILHKGDGSIPLPDLEKLNDEPVVISSQDAGTEETRNKGWNPPFFQFLETAKDLAAQGLQPGDTRAYYIVPRDFTGNYGATAGILVTVPDKAAPPPPWAVHTVNDPYGDGSFVLEWDHVDVQGFYRRHQHGRTYCNLRTARFDHELLWVPEGENCSTDHQIAVDLDVAEYLVYRFDSAADAAAFTDSDGDGWADSAEREILSVDPPADPPLTAPGTACNPDAGPADLGDAQNHLVTRVNASEAVDRSKGRRVLHYQDTVPVENRGRVYWYRIASVDWNNNISPLSAPTRGFFPDRQRPQPCTPTEEGGFILGELECGYRVEDKPESPYYAVDTTAGADAAYVETSCGYDPENMQRILSRIVQLPTGERGVAFDNPLCQQLEKNCSGQKELFLRFLSPKWEVLGERTLDYSSGSCGALSRSLLVDDCTDPTIRQVQSGDTVRGTLVIDCPTAEDECLTLYRDIGDQSPRLTTECPPPEQPFHFDTVGLVSMGGDQICLSAAKQNQNNEVSTEVRLPCFRVADRVNTEAVAPPQPLEITCLPSDPGSDAAAARLAWLPPEQPVVGSIIEWYRKGGENAAAFSDFIPHAGASADDGSRSAEVEIPPEPEGSGWEEEWCFRVRSVAHAGNLSDWSAARCAVRQPADDPLPQYIPWPKIPVPPALGDIDARYLPVDNMPVLLLTGPIDELSDCHDITNMPPPCTGDKQSACLQRGPESPVTFYCSNICETLNQGLAEGPGLNFVVYRQSTADREDSEQFGDYVQVSPLIDMLHCQADYTGTSPETSVQDPFIKLVDFSTGHAWEGNRLVFADHYPSIQGHWYRYQLVYFDDSGEITGHRQTDWIQVN